ncbi:MAG: hypothetical protein LBG79_08700 [Spirochaetaceae bacterium]|nr:hypothetical protein [Spirochaetaceae bacterium]
MKKRLIIAAAGLVFFLTGGTLFAQNKLTRLAEKIAVSFDFVPLVRANLLEENTAGAGGALNGEFFIAKNYSLGLRLEGLIVPDAGKSYFGADGHFRFYFKDADISGFFVDMGVGWGGLFIKVDPDSKYNLNVGGLTYNLKLGYKQMIASKFFVEPGFSYTLAKPTAGYGPGGFDLSFCAGFVFSKKKGT